MAGTMSRKRRINDDIQSRPALDIKVHQPAEEIAEREPKQDAEKFVPKWKQCPLCYNGDGGVGLVYRTVGRIQYLKCSSRGPLSTRKHIISDF